MSTYTQFDAVESYIHPDYRMEQNHLRELWVVCTHNGISYVVYDGYQKQVLMYRNYEVHDIFEAGRNIWKQFLESHDIFMNEFKRVKLGISHERFTLIPQSLFDEDETATFYAQKYRLSSEDRLATLRLADFGAQTIYSFPAFIAEEFSARYDQFRMFHHIHAWLSALYYQTQHLNKEVIYLHIQESVFDIAVIKKSQLQFCNAYRYNNPEDILYFVMHVYQSYRLQAEQHELYYTGSHTQLKAILSLLKTYVRNVQEVSLYALPDPGIHNNPVFLLQHCV